MVLHKHAVPEDFKVFKPKEPFVGKVVSNERITPEDSADQVHHIVLNLSGSGISYIEGQSIGIIAEGQNDLGKPHKLRLYSIASSRLGDDGQKSTVSLSVKRVLWQDEITGDERKGVCSNFLCDLQAGQDVKITGPIGRTFVLPEDDQTDLIMVAVGTGIAPFRAFLHDMYKEKGSWPGQVRLFFGAKTKADLLYMNEGRRDISLFYTEETFKAFNALSREGKQKVYVQNRLAEQKEDIWPIIKRGNFALYICGLKGMEQGITEVLTSWAAEEGLDWEEMKQTFKKEGRYNIEVY